MKLRRCFPFHQLLFLVVAVLTMTGAMAQDRIVTKDGKTQDVKIVGVNGTNLIVQVGAGNIGIPLSSVAQVVMPPPAEFGAAWAAYEKRNYSQALNLAIGTENKFRGLPVEWAQQLTILVGDIYVATNDLAKAEAWYKEFQQIYPGQGSLHVDVGMARIAVAKKDFAGAKEKLQPIAEQALKEKNISRAASHAYSQTFYLLGEVKEAEGDYIGALEDYLRTVTLFHHDRFATNAAQERADALRQEHSGIAVP